MTCCNFTIWPPLTHYNMFFLAVIQFRNNVRFLFYKITNLTAFPLRLLTRCCRSSYKENLKTKWYVNYIKHEWDKRYCHWEMFCKQGFVRFRQNLGKIYLCEGVIYFSKLQFFATAATKTTPSPRSGKILLPKFYFFKELICYYFIRL